MLPISAENSTGVAELLEEVLERIRSRRPPGTVSGRHVASVRQPTLLDDVLHSMLSKTDDADIDEADRAAEIRASARRSKSPSSAARTSANRRC